LSGRDEVFTDFVDAQCRDAAVTPEHKLPDFVGVEHLPVGQLQV